MAMNIDRIEEGDLTEEDNHNQEEESSKIKSQKLMKWGLLLLLSCICSFIGVTGGPLLLRLYFLHGGSRKWLSSWLQMAGFPILFIPLTVLYAKRDRSLPNIEFFASRKLLFYASLIGLVQGIDIFYVLLWFIFPSCNYIISPCYYSTRLHILHFICLG